MGIKAEPSIGQVYYVPDFPGLHGHVSKGRFCVVVHPKDESKKKGVLVVPTSSSSLSKYTVPMPNAQDNPNCSSGLPRRCDAVCDEPKILDADDLTDYRGTISTPLVNRIMDRTRAYVKSKTSAK